MQIFCSAFLHVSGAQAWHFAHSGCAMNLFFFLTCVILKIWNIIKCLVFQIPLIIPRRYEFEVILYHTSLYLGEMYINAVWFPFRANSVCSI